ncbi:ATP-binding protein [Saliphagus sp. GCM10025317]
MTDDRQPAGECFVLPPELQDRHLFIVGDTGSGKSVLTTGAMLSNTTATAGPEILFDYKGGGTAEEYLQTHYAATGGLDADTIQYFDLTKMLPALSLFDIGPLLDAGLSREEARSRIAGHYEEILAGLMGEEQYYSATESTKAIRNHLRALYDPIHGSDAISHKDLYRALQRTLSDRSPPPTSDERLTEYFAGLLERDRDVFNMVLGGGVARVETIATDDRLAPLFDYVYVESPDADHGDSAQDPGHELRFDGATQIEPEGKSDRIRNPHFDFIDVIDDDCVVIFDFGGMEERVKRALTLVLLSNMWSALKARAEAPDTPPNPPQVNLYLEEAKDVAATQLVDTLLSQGRSFGLSIMLGVQFPSQLDSPDPSNQTYEEALNEIGTLVVGNVSIEDDLAKTLATDDVPPRKVARRLAAIRHGEWLIRPAAEFGAPPARPFLGRSLAPPRGHPASDEPLTGEQKRAFDAAFEFITLETWRRSGLGHESEPTKAAHTGSPDDPDGDEPAHSESSLRVDSLLLHTKRFPDCVVYDEAIDALCCGSCENRYDPTIEGMKRAIECCHSLEDVDADDIPVCEINLKLTSAEREASEWSDRQLLFLQAVYNAQQLRYDPLEYDILSDSMLRLQEYVGIDNDDITPLLEADVLRHDTDHPHRLYTVSSDGRDAIGESYRLGVDYGHGAGDLEESSQHVFGIEVTRQYLEAVYAQSTDSSVTEVIPYYDLDDQHRLDLAGVDTDGEIVVTAEVERINNDYHRAVPKDFDKMASCEPDEAIWVVMKQADGHKVLSALNDPIEGEPRVEKTYAKTTPPQQFRIDTPGMTAVYPADWLREQY